MPIKLDDRTNLVQKINNLSMCDMQKLNIFLFGLEAGKALQITGVSAVKADGKADIEKME